MPPRGDAVLSNVWSVLSLPFDKKTRRQREKGQELTKKFKQHDKPKIRLAFCGFAFCGVTNSTSTDRDEIVPHVNLLKILFNPQCSSLLAPITEELKNRH